MIVPRSLQWRIALAFTALVIVVMGAFCILLFAPDPGEDVPVAWALTVTVVTGVLLIGGGTAIALGLGRPTSNTVEALTASARRIECGDLSHRVVTPTSSAAPELVEAFNTMAASVQRTVRGIEFEQRLSTIAMDTMADGVVIVDSENRTRFINRAAHWLLGTSPLTSQDLPLPQVIRDPDLLRLVADSAASRQIQQSEIELLYHRRFLNVIATPISGEFGEGVLLTLQDVTGLRQVQTTRREFVTNVSHELRSPLASVMAMTETLQNGAIDDERAREDFLNRISSDVERMTALVDELLELSRLESGQVPVHLSPVRVSDVVEEIAERFRLQAVDSDIELVLEVPSDLPQVMAEAGKLDQILTNLIENALRFTPEGGRITLAARAEPRLVRISVADTGVGIPREHLPHVFERFYKVDRARRGGGTGLGLAIVKHLAQAHGGEISATSTEGEGSTFTLTLTRAT